MALRQRLLKAEKRCPAPPENGWPGLQVFLAESKRMKEWLAATGLTAQEAARRRMKVPGNTFLTPKLQAEVDRRRAEGEATSSMSPQGEAACTSKRETPPS
ncbi:MAG: hypothetical protein U0744_04600 [Gemmataceae bacterium]